MRKIMVVDNEPDIVDLTRTVLELGGYNVVTASSGEECLRKLEDEPVDLILLDIMMPGMSGWDVFNRIKNKSLDTKVAFLSVLEISEKRKQVLLNEGLADYIMKPFDKDTLLDRIDKIMEKKEQEEKEKEEEQEV
ncbi:MAG: response regulator [Candidatus Thermoplasmatota archaeon]